MNILVYNSPARGHLYPIMPTLFELQKRGHELHVRTLSSELALCASHNLSAVAVSPAIEQIEMSDYLGRSEADRIKRAYEVFTRRAALELDDLQSAIDELEPDFLLLDVNTLGAQLIAEQGALPWAVFSPFLLPVAGEGVPPFGPGLAPMSGILGRLRDRVISKAVSMMLNKAGLAAYNDLRVRIGLEPVDDVVKHPYSKAPLLLAYTPQSLDYQREYPANVFSVGPGTWGPETETDEPPNERPAILVTTSSEYQADEMLARTAIDALSNEAEELIVTTPAVQMQALDVPAGVRVERFVDHAPILARASVVVTHGGMGSTQKALAAGVPVVVVPFGRDQLEVAQRVVHAGVGVSLKPKKLNATSLKAAVVAARKLRPAAVKMAEKFRQAPGAAGAADAIEALSR